MMSALFLLFFGLFLELNSLPFTILLMVFMSVLIFFTIWASSGACWYSLVFCLLFVGGILVVFMVVSSLFPNVVIQFPRVSKKFIFIFIASTYSHYFLSSFSMASHLKSAVFSGGSFVSLTSLILCFFFCFIYFISKDKLSLRSFF